MSLRWTPCKNPVCSSRVKRSSVRRRQASFSETDLNNFSTLVEKHPNLPITLKRITPDGGEVVITAGKQVVGNGVTADEVNEWDELYDGDVQDEAR
jgi:hypothetical protein